MGVIRLGTFTPSVLLDVTRASGRLDEAGLEVLEVPVPSSPEQFAALRSGDLDAVFTSPDNVIAYAFLPGNPLGQLLDVEILAGLDRGLGLCLAARPGIDGIDELRGHRLGVDVPNSGFAFVAYELLARRGLARDDYEIVTLGSTPKRAAALLAGTCDVTVLNAGNELRAYAGGATLLAQATELGPYLGTVVAQMRDNGERHAVDRLTRALITTSHDVLTGKLSEQLLSSAAAVLGLDERQAAEHVAVLLDPRQGLIPDGQVDVASLTTLVELRRASLPMHELDGVLGHLDRILDAAVLPG